MFKVARNQCCHKKVDSFDDPFFGLHLDLIIQTSDNENIRYPDSSSSSGYRFKGPYSLSDAKRGFSITVLVMISRSTVSISSTYVLGMRNIDWHTAFGTCCTILGCHSVLNCSVDISMKWNGGLLPN